MHKSLSERRVVKKHINAKQEEGVAQLVGAHAGKMAKALKDKRKTEPVMDSDTWNVKNRDLGFLKGNNARLAETDDKDVKASTQFLAYTLEKSSRSGLFHRCSLNTVA